MARPSAVIRFAGMVLFGKQPVRTAALVITPFVMVGPTHVEAGLARVLSGPASAGAIISCGPGHPNRKIPLRSGPVGIAGRSEAEVRRMSFHSRPPKKKNLSLIIGPPRLPPKLL